MFPMAAILTKNSQVTIAKWSQSLLNYSWTIVVHELPRITELLLSDDFSLTILGSILVNLLTQMISS
jgi:hypothetical protein